MAKTTYKKQQLETKILDEVNMMFRSRFNDPRFKNVTITKVELTSDYSYAHLYWDSFDTENRKEYKRALNGVVPKVRSLLSKILDIRRVPEISFHFDAQYESEQKISQLLAEEEKLGKFGRNDDLVSDQSDSDECEDNENDSEN